ILTFQNHTNRPLTDFGGKTSIFSHPVYLFLREFSLQDFRGGSVRLITMELQNFLPCCIQKKAVANFDRFSDENDDGDTQIRINEQ
ncbi:hypothetical protein, partial [Escherichia coli]|uniref:hypothetical protein n=1 Tax=Escherichia coli TaxID=562 RepID=UPI001C6FD631